MKSEREFNFLQICRRQSSLSQGDISFIADLNNTVSLSRYESGHRIPPTEILFIYHIIFDKPVAALLPDYIEALQQKVLNKCKVLQQELSALASTDQKSTSKAIFLDEVITRLEQLHH